ncbi:FecR domain-containing protein [bacterium]|nr:FecR domain-containing protein [bacterium]
MKKILCIATILLMSFFSLNAENSQEREYTNETFARVSYVSGEAYIQRASEIGYEEGIANMPLTEGDRIGTTEGRAEIYLGDSNYIRLDHNTKVDFLNLPTRKDDLIQIKIWTGNVYFSIESLKEEKNIQIHTTDVSAYILDQGTYRIDVKQNEETEIFVFAGLLEAAGETGSTLVKKAQKINFVQGHSSSGPSQFMGVAEDNFDRWSEDRESQVRQQIAQDYLPQELDDFEHELASYGDWAYVPPYGNVWVPGGVGPEWQPYHYGRWTWLSMCGWTWVPYEPWGWATFHYGRWHWSSIYGWYWIPTTRWGPAWVSWHWGYDYFAWSPMSYYGYPGVVINNIYYDHYTGAYPYRSNALTVIHKSQLKAPNVSKVALSQNSIKNVSKLRLSNKGSTIKPSTHKVTQEKLKGQKILLRRSQNSVELKNAREVSKTSLRNLHPSRIRKSGTEAPRKSQLEKRNILNRKYPSSPHIHIKKRVNKSKTSRSNSALSRIYKHFSGKNISIRKSSSTSSSKISSRRIKSSSSRSISSRRTTSHSSSSSSSKVKKKKNK